MRRLRRGIFLAGIGTVLVCWFYSGAPAQESQKYTPENWTEFVGFAPDLTLGQYEPGEVINKDNLGKAKDLIPETLTILINKYGLSLPTRKYEPVYPSTGYMEATSKYARKATILDIGNEYRKKGLKGFVAGLPFPQPQNGIEVAWNYHYSYQGDDADNHYGVYWISAKRGVERWEEWKWLYIINGLHRTDVDPKPAIPDFQKKDIQYASFTYAMKPYDKKGLTALYYRVEDPLDMEGWLYIPAMRRVLRASFGTRGDAWNNTDMLYEDVRGYMGYPEWMNWKIVEKRTMLAVMHAGVEVKPNNFEEIFDSKSPPHWNPVVKWEPRPVYVLEVTPKFPDYPYSRMVMYYDAEMFYIHYKEIYDKKGDLWKLLINGYNESPKLGEMPSAIGFSVIIDLQAEHASAFPWYGQKVNVGFDPSFFSLSNLRKIGR